MVDTNRFDAKPNADDAPARCDCCGHWTTLAALDVRHDHDGCESYRCVDAAACMGRILDASRVPEPADVLPVGDEDLPF